MQLQFRLKLIAHAYLEEENTTNLEKSVYHYKI